MTEEQEYGAEHDEETSDARASRSEDGRFTSSPQALIDALDRLAWDADLRKRLEEQPVETLRELGIELEPEVGLRMEGRKLSEIMGEAWGMSPEEAARTQLMPMVGVGVATRGTKPVTRGTKPATNTRVGSAVKGGVKSVSGGITSGITATITTEQT
jgi:hypothetical protein